MVPVSALSSEVKETHTRGNTIVLPGQTPEGAYILSVLLKRTYDIVSNRVCCRAEKEKPLYGGDVYWDDPMNSSVRYESDFTPFKLATDVVVNGTVHAPGGQAVASCRASLQVGERRKELLVTGDRTAHFVQDGEPQFTDPLPFTAMDLRYERSYGGIDVYSDKTTSYPYLRNPLGLGFVVANSARSVDRLPLPNIEEPDETLTPQKLCIGEYKAWEQQPFPAGFGWYPKSWLPRSSLAGIMPADRALEQELRQIYAKLVPASQREAYLTNGLPDMDFRFFNGASRGLVLPFLEGGEFVQAENLTPDGALAFRLPEDQPLLGLDIGFGVEEPQVVLHTVMIRMDDLQVDLVWRGAVPYPGPDWLPEMKKMEVFVTEGGQSA